MMMAVKRRMFTAASALSLLLCVATCAAWCRSYWRCDGISYGTSAPSFTLCRNRTFSVVARTGRIQFKVFRVSIEGPRASEAFAVLLVSEPISDGWNGGNGEALYDALPVVSRWNKLGFFGQHEHADGQMAHGGPIANVRKTSNILWIDFDVTQFVLPYWLLAALTLSCPILLLARRLKPSPTAGHCTACGYDLRATPDRCPECGKETKTPTKVACGNQTT